MTPEQRLHLDEWLGALRSGTYRQTTGRLIEHQPGWGEEPRYCVLGVLCETAGLERQSHWDYFRGPDGEAWTSGVDEEWFADFTGLPYHVADSLIGQNDNCESSFPELADFIKESTS